MVWIGQALIQNKLLFTYKTREFQNVSDAKIIRSLVDSLITVSMNCH